MSGFCGSCGRPRVGDAAFCGGCGSRFAPAIRLCPTCGQSWPEAAPAPAELAPAVTVAAGPERGAYTSAMGNVYFDGLGWFAAVDAGGVWIPDPSSPRPGFDPVTYAAVLMHAEAGATPGSSNLPRGPAIGPDYDPARDCGNCGFDLEGAPAPCKHCGSANVGSQFIP